MSIKLLDMTLDQLQRTVEKMGEKPYRAKQLAEWVYCKGVTDPKKMSNLPPRFGERFDILSSHVAKRSKSTDGTLKLLLEFPDGQCVECVLIPTARRTTACLSTQVGCAMGCKFCASGLGGLNRNLSAAEILEQILHLQTAAKRMVSHVVFMGMGEPLANYDATVRAVRAITDPDRFGISSRRVTISTIGLVKQIRRLGKEDLPVTLAISLHAPNDAIREQLIPSAKATSLEEIISAAEMFYSARKREITLEYLLLGGVNDTTVCAESLIRIAHRLRCNVNLIGYNPVESLGFTRPSTTRVRDFASKLRGGGVNVHIRRSRGLDADSACGQLRARTQS